MADVIRRAIRPCSEEGFATRSREWSGREELLAHSPSYIHGAPVRRPGPSSGPRLAVPVWWDMNCSRRAAMVRGQPALVR